MFNRFKEHPNALGETYWQHMIEALKISALFGIASIACFVHAVFPFLFVTTASGIAKNVLQNNDERAEND